MKNIIKTRFRRAFTIVELVIVIAVIAALAAVLIPTFANVVNSANESSDMVTVKNLNTILSTSEAIDGEAATMSDALAVAAENGYNVDKLTPSSSGDIVWDQVSNRFLLINEDGEIVYSDSTTSSDVLSTKYQLWYIAQSDSDLTNKQGYSFYLNYTTTSVENAIAGIDVGENTNVDIEYSASNEADIIFNTNGGSLTVDNEKATVTQYGYSDNVEITAVDDESFYEYGKVSGTMSVLKGHIVVKKAASVNLIDASKATGTVKIETESSDSVASVCDGGNEYVIVDSSLSSKKIEIAKVGTNETYETVQAALDEGKTYIQLTSDLTITKYIEVKHNVTIDGSNYKINFNGTEVTDTSVMRGIIITTNDVTVVLNNLTVDVRTNVTSNNYYPRGVQVSPDVTGVTLQINNCDISARHYAVNICNGAEVNLKITSSNLTGWSALNLWSATYNVYVKNSKLEGINNHAQESFGVVVLEGDTTGKTYTHSSFIDVEIVNTEIIAKVEAENALQQFIAFNDNSVGNTVSLTGCTLTSNISESITTASTTLFYNGGSNNSLYIDGESIDINVVVNCWYSNGDFSANKTTENAMTTNLSYPFLYGWMADGEGIILTSNVTLAENIICYLTSGTIYFYLDNYTITGGTITLQAGVTVITDTSVSNLFVDVSDNVITGTSNSDGTYTYTYL